MELVIVTGLSGAGKSLVLRQLEDFGYYCVDNLPSKLIKPFITLCQTANPPVFKAAVVIDSRESVFGHAPYQTLRDLGKTGIDYQILFLDCRDDILIRRYSETRRRHPLCDHEDIQSCITRDREFLQFMRDRANYIIDTSDLKPLQLAELLQKTLSLAPDRRLSLMFMSFGYKRGVPIDTDMLFDMRFLPNPFYEQELRQLSGLDAPVREFILSHQEARDFFDATETLLRSLLPGFIAQDKPRLTVAFGCTGGRHRSVAAAAEMAKRFSNEPYRIQVLHRDFIAEADDIRQRSSPS